jgi:hypothetical protein
MISWSVVSNFKKSTYQQGLVVVYVLELFGVGVLGKNRPPQIKDDASFRVFIFLF